VEALNDQGVPCGPHLQVDEVFADAQVQHLGIARTLNGGNRNVAYVGQPIDCPARRRTS
jgi:crotonobetainyl-CoA:carnitine CoA-transferase CaiB-like acyl-CoA transferase